MLLSSTLTLETDPREGNRRPMDSKRDHPPPKRQYPAFYERLVPIALIVIVVVIVILLLIILSVALGVFPGVG